MPENRSTTKPSARPSSGTNRTLSLVEVAQETGIAMPILLRYKREQPERVVSTGSGSQQRFPEEALDVFRAIHRDEAETSDLPQRGGSGLLSMPRLRRKRSDRAREDEMARKSSTAAPEETPAPKKRGRKSRSSTSAKPQAPKQSEGGDLRSLQEVSKELGVPYPTLARYMQRMGDRIPHVGKGRKRRFPPEALEVFRTIRENSHPGRPPKGGQKDPLAKAKAGPRAPRAPARSTAAPRTAAPSARAAVTGAEDNGDLAARIARLESSQLELEDEIRNLVRRLSAPVSVTVHEI